MQNVTPEQFFGRPEFADYALLDVRSPAEYREGCLPGARSLPLFSDEERARVGTLYKQDSPDAALLTGLEIVGPKMRPLVERARAFSPNGKIVVHCWRGGQRSGSVGWLLEQAGMQVLRLSGGYKAARKYLRSWLAQDHHTFRVLSGPTGSGKTEVLTALKQLGQHIVDLEGLANHKGSSFGALGEAPQPTTEAFENMLFGRLLEIPRGAVVWLEDESRMIGTVYQPDEFYDRLTAAPVYTIEQPRSWRIERLVSQYAKYPMTDLVSAFTRLRKKLGGQHLKAALEALDQQDYATAAEIALVYYDKAYQYYGERRGAKVVAVIDAPAPDPVRIAQAILKLGRG
ncbi:tRNA 2-selenouridine(34) synthase MnmH [Lewinella sp. W8]|uniref:tRNA 2-selenouridine(34) synthase MnmH n=1 Tax=Lewinella sp. W8 TaxID=2528208 RepID=UPI001067D27D|nr:tRNA 2-selenouridine(34) synthase MnmH [Lewinella sp. W8]MTB51048.1 tRNA 2-selenouridine(34) synthase MnmH [Lewinella sp. W8]